MKNIFFIKILIMNEIRIATLGQVDAGKSTLISLLSQNSEDKLTFLDDGRGLARSKILRFKHEMESGRTSSITNCCLNTKNNIITFVDLAGHEKYLGTTIAGLTGCSIDYVMIVIGANTDIIPRTTKEHLALAVSLNLPIIFVITKIDIPNNLVFEETVNNLRKLMLSKATKRKTLYKIDNQQDIDNYTSLIETNYNICPLFYVSNVTGEGIINLKKTLSNIKSTRCWNKSGNTLFTIEESFNVIGIGLVIYGIVNRGTIRPNDIYFLGPFHGKYKKVIIKGIHDNFRNNTSILEAGHSGCLWIKNCNAKEKIFKNNIKRGMVLNSLDTSVISFKADIMILHHPTTIKINYQPIIHCGTIKQTAKISQIKEYEKDKNIESSLISKLSEFNNYNNLEILRSGDKAIVQFEFMFHPEYLEKNSIIVFREGKTKGFGKIIDITTS